jgi:hypothetical protein
MDPSASPPGLGPLDGAATFATTEHFTLQTARAITVSEANGRMSSYLAALSSVVIALAFIGQISQIGPTFNAFALVQLPVLTLLGASTFVRLVQSSLEDFAYAQRIALVRAYYLLVAPGLEPYVVVDRGSPSTVRAGARLLPSARQLTLTAAGTVAVVDSVVAAACAGIALNASGVPWLPVVLAGAAAIGAAAFALHELHHRRALKGYRPDGVDVAAILVPAPREDVTTSTLRPVTSDHASGRPT